MKKTKNKEMLRSKAVDRKLSLTTLTIRPLDTQELVRAHGGWNTGTCAEGNCPRSC